MSREKIYIKKTKEQFIEWLKNEYHYTPRPEPGPVGHPETIFTFETGNGIKTVSLNIDGKLKNLWKWDESVESNILDYDGSEKLRRFDLVSVDIGNTVTSISEEAFSYCSALTSVTIPASVTSIQLDAFSYCGDSLYDTTTIPGVRLVDGWAIGGYTDLLSGHLDLTGVRGIADSAFASCTNLTSVTIHEGVVSIGYGAFSGCGDLANVTISSSVTSIGQWAFDFCSNLTRVTFLGKTPIEVQEMDNYIWGIPTTCIIECTDEKLIYIDGEWTSAKDNNVYYTTTSNDGWHVGTNVQFTAGEKEGEVIFNDFTEKHDATRVIIPSKDDSGNTVTSIGESAFDSCTSLTSVTIPDGVTSLRGYAFYSCSGLTHVTIPDSVTSIEGGVFNSCTGLTTMTIPDRVTVIGRGAFGNCGSLTSVTIGNGMMSIESDVFISCESVTDVYCYPNPANLTWIEDYCDDFKTDGSTICHVKSEYLSEYQSKFSGEVNVTFVGDLT